MKKIIFCILAAVLLAGCAKVEISKDSYRYDTIKDFDRTVWISHRVVEEVSDDVDGAPETGGSADKEWRIETIELSMSYRGSYGVCTVDVSVSDSGTHELTSFYYNILSENYIELSSIENTDDKVTVCLVKDDRLIITDWPEKPEYVGLIFTLQIY